MERSRAEPRLRQTLCSSKVCAVTRGSGQECPGSLFFFDNTMLTLFADGSSTGGNPGKAGCGYALMREGQLLEGLGQPLGTATNNQAELTAVLLGLTACLGKLQPQEEILIVGDSVYVLDGLRLADAYGTDPGRSNNKLWASIYDVMLELYAGGHRLKTYWVKGHDGNPGNTLCDELAFSSAVTQRRHRPAKQRKT